jgi:hypothetical protein
MVRLHAPALQFIFQQRHLFSARRHDIVASRKAIRSIDGEIVSSEVVNILPDRIELLYH